MIFIKYKSNCLTSNKTTNRAIQRHVWEGYKDQIFKFTRESYLNMLLIVVILLLLRMVKKQNVCIKVFIFLLLVENKLK